MSSSDLTRSQATNSGRSSAAAGTSGDTETGPSPVEQLPVSYAPLVAVQREISVSSKRSFAQVQALEKQAVGRRPLVNIATEEHLS